MKLSDRPVAVSEYGSGSGSLTRSGSDLPAVASRSNSEGAATRASSGAADERGNVAGALQEIPFVCWGRTFQSGAEVHLDGCYSVERGVTMYAVLVVPIRDTPDVRELLEHIECSGIATGATLLAATRSSSASTAAAAAAAVAAGGAQIHSNADVWATGGSGVCLFSSKDGSVSLGPNRGTVWSPRFVIRSYSISI